MIDTTRPVETTRYSEMMGRMIRAYGRRVADGDTDDLAGFAAFIEDTERIFNDTVQEMRKRHGWSWAQIGDALGISRQAAQQRFGGDGMRRVGGQPAELR